MSLRHKKASSLLVCILGNPRGSLEWTLEHLIDALIRPNLDDGVDVDVVAGFPQSFDSLKLRLAQQATNMARENVVGTAEVGDAGADDVNTTSTNRKTVTSSSAISYRTEAMDERDRQLHAALVALNQSEGWNTMSLSNSDATTLARTSVMGTKVEVTESAQTRRLLMKIGLDEVLVYEEGRIEHYYENVKKFHESGAAEVQKRELEEDLAFAEKKLLGAGVRFFHGVTFKDPEPVPRSTWRKWTWNALARRRPHFTGFRVCQEGAEAIQAEASSSSKHAFKERAAKHSNTTLPEWDWTVTVRPDLLMLPRAAIKNRRQHIREEPIHDMRGELYLRPRQLVEKSWGLRGPDIRRSEKKAVPDDEPDGELNRIKDTAGQLRVQLLDARRQQVFLPICQNFPIAHVRGCPEDKLFVLSYGVAKIVWRLLGRLFEETWRKFPNVDATGVEAQVIFPSRPLLKGANWCAGGADANDFHLLGDPGVRSGFFPSYRSTSIAYTFAKMMVCAAQTGTCVHTHAAREDYADAPLAQIFARPDLYLEELRPHRLMESMIRNRMVHVSETAEALVNASIEEAVGGLVERISTTTPRSSRSRTKPAQMIGEILERFRNELGTREWKSPIYSFAGFGYVDLPFALLRRKKEGRGACWDALGIRGTGKLMGCGFVHNMCRLHLGGSVLEDREAQWGQTQSSPLAASNRVDSSTSSASSIPPPCDSEACERPEARWSGCVASKMIMQQTVDLLRISHALNYAEYGNVPGGG
ncbi:unnamed protein product [Amoebophrya sp. A25]|nr:unnamed protein product [Amoebophrya sp. A25]|eukprot:GSA25T00003139001.1